MQTVLSRIASIARPPVWMRQALKFLLVGVGNTALDALIYYLLTRGIPFFAAQPALAKGISYSVGILNSFFWNRLWTFRSQPRAGRTLLPYLLTNLSGLALNTGMMQLGLRLLGLPEAVAFLLATAVTTGWNFVVSKFFVFRKAN